MIKALLNNYFKIINYKALLFCYTYMQINCLYILDH